MRCALAFKPFIVLLMAVLVLVGCGDECGELDQGLRELVADGIFDDQDYLQALDLFRKLDCASGYSDTMRCSGALALMESRVKGLRLRKPVEWQVDCRTIEEAPVTQEPLRVKFFLENTGSHDGYVRDRTEFKGAIMDLLVDLRYHYDSTTFHFINGAGILSEVPQDIEFIQNLQPRDLKVGDYSSSEFREIFRLILSDLKENQVSILVSDCVYSISGKDTEGQLNFAQAGLKQVFLNELKQEQVAVAVVQLSSLFNGKYWDMRGGSKHFVELKKVQRPYYAWFFGSPEAMARLEGNIDFEKFEGFKNSYFLDWHRNPIAPTFTILQGTKKVGRFRSDRQNTQDGRIFGIVEAEQATRGETQGVLQFAIAADLGGLRMPDDYLADTGNYDLPEEFTVVEVLPFNRNQVDASDWPSVQDKGYTHILVIRTDVNPALLPEFKLQLRRNVPAWVEASTTLDDLQMDKRPDIHDKTFGFSYIVGGITDAYRTAYPANEHIFQLQASIKSK